MYEILLTRIFSVTLWYHFAFMVVSIAMFGMAVGAMRVYLDPKYAEQLMAESIPDEDLPSTSLPRKGPGTETTEEVVGTTSNAGEK